MIWLMECITWIQENECAQNQCLDQFGHQVSLIRILGMHLVDNYMNPSFIHGAAKTTQIQVNAYLSDLKSSTAFLLSFNIFSLKPIK